MDEHRIFLIKLLSSERRVREWDRCRRL